MSICPHRWPIIEMMNFCICPHRYVEAGGSGCGYGKLDMLITRDDVPEFPEIPMADKDPFHLFLSVDHSYIYSFLNHSLPNKFVFQALGLDSGHSLQVGFCVPLGVPAGEIRFLGSNPVPVQVESYLELVEDQSGAAFYWDQQVGVVFRKFKVYEPRTSETATACVGGNYECPSFRILTAHPGDTDCTARAYPKYQKPPIP